MAAPDFELDDISRAAIVLVMKDGSLRRAEFTNRGSLFPTIFLGQGRNPNSLHMTALPTAWREVPAGEAARIMLAVLDDQHTEGSSK